MQARDLSMIQSHSKQTPISTKLLSVVRQGLVKIFGEGGAFDVSRRRASQAGLVPVGNEDRGSVRLVGNRIEIQVDVPRGFFQKAGLSIQSV